jgi:hypothetical protein
MHIPVCAIADQKPNLSGFTLIHLEYPRCNLCVNMSRPVTFIQDLMVVLSTHSRRASTRQRHEPPFTRPVQHLSARHDAMMLNTDMTKDLH